MGNKAFKTERYSAATGPYPLTDVPSTQYSLRRSLCVKLASPLKRAITCTIRQADRALLFSSGEAFVIHDRSLRIIPCQGHSWPSPSTTRGLRKFRTSAPGLMPGLLDRKERWVVGQTCDGFVFFTCQVQKSEHGDNRSTHQAAMYYDIKISFSECCNTFQHVRRVG